ncbi:hypothetical protein SAY86_011012 [Trapa natans]|uniref:RRM domain-containing protein n=1 Tax=Trapa natans TaxID=22666 RepID=A0AAN7LLF8_TRANT|nr:hypothetical protein SAY86_011012 [Trapa natans]
MVDRSDDGTGDTTFTKVFVGGLAWKTKRDTVRRYFEQFGEILEAVVISQKNTDRSKGYGFVTFRDPESARRACENQFPVIDGRRANCNLAFLGARRSRPTAASMEGTMNESSVIYHSKDQMNIQVLGKTNNAGMERFRQKPAAPSSSFDAHPVFFHQAIPHGSYPYSYSVAKSTPTSTTFRCPGGYSQDFFPVVYHGVYGGHQQQLLSHYITSGSGAGSHSHGFYLSYYPYYAHPGQYPKLVQYPLHPHQLRNTLGLSAIPHSASQLPIMTTARAMAEPSMTGMGLETQGSISEQKSSD